jgi:hypothetical protein
MIRYKVSPSALWISSSADVEFDPWNTTKILQRELLSTRNITIHWSSLPKILRLLVGFYSCKRTKISFWGVCFCKGGSIDMHGEPWRSRSSTVTFCSQPDKQPLYMSGQPFCQPCMRPFNVGWSDELCHTRGLDIMSKIYGVKEVIIFQFVLHINIIYNN